MNKIIIYSTSGDIFLTLSFFLLPVFNVFCSDRSSRSHNVWAPIHPMKTIFHFFFGVLGLCQVNTEVDSISRYRFYLWNSMYKTKFLFVVLIHFINAAKVLPSLSVVALGTFSPRTLRLSPVIAIPGLGHGLAALVLHAIHKVVCSLYSTVKNAR